jgi:flap endonuclease-1
MGLAIKDLVPSKEIKIPDLKDKWLVVDTFNLLYQFLTTIRSRDGTPLQDSKGNITSHLVGLFARTTKLMDEGLKLAFVFDGTPPKLKQEERERRKALKAVAQKQYKIAVQEEDIESMKKFASRTVSLTKEIIEESKLLVQALGLPIIQAPSEGEAQAAYMVHNGDAYAVVSQDYDSLMHGSTTLVRNLSVAGKRKRASKASFETIQPEIILLKDLYSNLDINADQFIALGMLVGTDYNKGGIKGIGPKNAIKLVRLHKDDLETLFKEVKWNDFYTLPWKRVFDTIKDMPVTKEYHLEIKEIQEDKLKELLIEKHDFSEERVLSTIKKLQSKKDEQKQKTLGDF